MALCRQYRHGLAVLFAGLSLACMMTSADTAFASTKSLKLYYLHTGEKETITFKKNGKYIDSGLKKINKFLRDWRRNEPTRMDPRLLDLIWEVYQETGSKQYIHVISGYRSPATNSMLRKRGRGVAKKSQHTMGKALDFFIPGVKLSKLRAIGLKKGLGGVGYYPKSGSPFVHMDTGRVRHWPRMTRKQLVKVFPRGKTLHVPSDGKPLTGYNLAKAEYERKVGGQNTIVIAKAEDIEKKPNLFQRLLGAGEDGEEGVASSSPAPTPVKTTIKPVAPASRPTPERVIAAISPASIPIPVIAPRGNENSGEQTVIAAAIQGAGSRPAIPGSPEDPPLQETAFATAIPSQRPQYSPAEGDRPSNQTPEPQTSVQLAALSPTEIEDLRREVNTVLNSEKIKPANDPEIVQPVIKIAGIEPIEPGYTTSGLIAVPKANPANSASQAINQQVASLEPIEPGTSTSGDIALPQANPTPGAEEEPTLVAALLPLEPGTVASGNTAFPVPNPGKAVSGEEPTIGTLIAGIPVPQPNPNAGTLIASLEQAGRPEAVNDKSLAKTTSLEEFSIAGLEKNLVGKWALEANTSIAQIADIRSPAYGRNAIRQLPSTVLSRGFTRDNITSITDKFTGSSVEFLDFTKFN